jgi:hypothetical protein
MVACTSPEGLSSLLGTPPYSEDTAILDSSGTTGGQIL